jgi:F0F1-type ATP synthase delta subunit
MRASHYARALHELLIEKPEKADEYVARLAEAVRTRGDEHLFPRILRSLERLRARDEHERTIVVTTASALPESEVGALLRKEPFKHLLTAKHKKVVRREDDSLIGGAVVTAGSLRVDTSYKRALIDLYHDITD